MTKDQYSEYIQQQLISQGFVIHEFRNYTTGLWMNPNPQSFRLSQIGFRLFQQISNLTHHCINFDIDLKYHQVLLLDRKLSDPFFYTAKKNTPLELHVFGDSGMVLWLKLYNDIDKFLENYCPNKG